MNRLPIILPSLVLLFGLLNMPPAAARAQSGNNGTLVFPETAIDTSPSALPMISDVPSDSYYELDEAYLDASAASGYGPEGYQSDWGLHVLPVGLIYRSYLAGPKESRLATEVINIPEQSNMWVGTLGARVGLLRYGNSDPIRPVGFQWDIEASAQLRLDIPEDVDVISADYRVGVPLTWGDAHRQWKFAYYHLSSHLGDEFLVKNENFPLFFQARDALVLGHSVYLTDSLRLYGEVGWAFYSNASEPWEVQFGVDFAPRVPTGLHGAPFFAINAYLREELNFGGGLNVQAGWAWRSDTTAHLLRMGLQYYNGASTQYAFLPFHEQQIGFGVWYDF